MTIHKKKKRKKNFRNYLFSDTKNSTEHINNNTGENPQKKNLRHKENKKNMGGGLDTVAHTCNPSYSGDRDGEDTGWRTA
jgi:hypothetical protein